MDLREVRVHGFFADSKRDKTNAAVKKRGAMIVPPEILVRLDKLERSNRHLKGSLSVALLFAVGLVCMGAAGPKVIEAEKFILRDSSGAERGEMFATDAARGLVFFNKNGERAVGLLASDQMNGLLIMDQNGNPRQSMTANLDKSTMGVYRPGSDSAQFEVINTAQGTALTVRDRANIDRVSLGQSGKGAVLVMTDTNGNDRTIMADGVLGFASFSKDGGVDWSPGWDKFSPEEQKQLNNLFRGTVK